MDKKPIMLKKGMQIAARVTPKGQKGAGSVAMFVMPKTEVTNVRGCKSELLAAVF